MDEILSLSEKLQERSREVIRESGIVDVWESVGARVNLIGSAKMGLIMKNRDLDFHIYSSPLTVKDSFAAMAKFAENPKVKHIEYGNLIDTEEECMEWHVLYQFREDEMWKMDMIHIREGSRYDGYMEKVSDRIMKMLTPETRRAILRLKYDTPETESIMGIEYYKAVLGDGIRTYDEFIRWRKDNPAEGVVHWVP